MNTTPKVSSSKQLMSEWDFEKNRKNGRDPEKLTLGSGYNVGWICPLGHKYDATINSRHRGTGCPYCSNTKVLKGFNDLETKYPEIAKEWHPDKNGDLKPSDVTYGSGKEVWWICKYKHEYQRPVKTRVHAQGCPICSKALKTSFPEQAIFYYIKKAFPDAVNNYKDIFDNGMELDIYIPSIKVGIEYDGSTYHKINRLKNDNLKYNICREKGIVFIRISEYEQSSKWRLSHRKIEIPSAKDEYLDYAISMLCYKLDRPQDVNVARDRLKIQSYLSEKRTSLLDVYPDLAKQWDYEKNEGLLPEQFAVHSNERVNWICDKCGHHWSARISERTREDGKKTGCPKCNAKDGRNKQIQLKIQEGGSLAELYPDLMEEWDFDKNEINPYSVLPNSAEHAFWICSKCGYRWETKIANRTSKGHGCRLCSKQDTVKGINDLTTTRPDLLEEWNYEKNELGPENYSEHSNQKVWWKCKVCGHEWPASINMKSRGHGCPACSGRVPTVGVNDLKTLRPEIAIDWDYSKNEFGPEHYKVHSSAKVSWRCHICGHEWMNKISNRTRNPGCPECKKQNKESE